jgi:hypothetical protein
MKRASHIIEDEGPLAGFLPMVDCYAAIAIVFIAKWAACSVQQIQQRNMPVAEPPLESPKIVQATADLSKVTLKDDAARRLELQPGLRLGRSQAGAAGGPPQPLETVLAALRQEDQAIGHSKPCLLLAAASVPAAELVKAIAAFHAAGLTVHLLPIPDPNHPPTK